MAARPRPAPPSTAAGARRSALRDARLSLRERGLEGRRARLHWRASKPALGGIAVAPCSICQQQQQQLSRGARSPTPCMAGARAVPPCVVLAMARGLGCFISVRRSFAGASSVDAELGPAEIPRSTAPSDQQQTSGNGSPCDSEQQTSNIHIHGGRVVAAQCERGQGPGAARLGLASRCGGQGAAPRVPIASARARARTQRRQMGCSERAKPRLIAARRGDGTTRRTAQDPPILVHGSH
jgi:hypothetical protein